MLKFTKKSYKLLFLGHRGLIKKITQTAVINIAFQSIFYMTWRADHFSQSRFQTSIVYDIYIAFKNCNGHFWKCMLTSIQNVKSYKNALEYNVYHRCLCYFLAKKCMVIRTLPDTASRRMPYISFLILTFLNRCISVKTSPINTKVGEFVNFGMLFLTMWNNSC